MKRGLRWVAAGGVALLATYVGIGSVLVAPYRHAQAQPPQYLHAEKVTLPSRSGATIAAWVIVPETPRAVVVILHGVHADRGTMLGRAELFWREGFAVVIPDFQAHGESTGEHVTFGFLESRDADACLSYAKHRFPRLPLAGVGVSMGGAALALASEKPLLDAVVLEAVYPTIAEAVDNRIALRLGALSKVLTPLLLLQLEPRLGINSADLRPIDRVPGFKCPLLIISGGADRNTTEEQTRALFEAAPSPKDLWLVPGAGHVDLLKYDKPGYSQHVLAYLLRTLVQERRSGLTSG